MAAPNLRSMVLFRAAATVVVVLLVGLLQVADAEVTKANLNLRDCDPDGNGISVTPSPTNCPNIIKVIPKGGSVYIYCKRRGSSVNGDPWWLYVKYGSYKPGFVADYYVDCGGIVCPYRTCT